MHSSIFILILSCFSCLSITKAQWVDPYSMDSSTKDRLPSRPPKDPEKQPEQNFSSQTKCDSDIHLKRVIRLLLSSIYLDSDTGDYEGYINIKFNTIERELLLNFAQNSDSQHKPFSEITTILEHALQKPSDHYHQIVLSLQEQLYELIFNPTSAALAAACIFLYILYKLVMAEFRWKSIIKFFIFFLYVLDFIITYLHILRDAEIDGMVHAKTRGTTPPECNPAKMSWWTYAKTQFESTFFENPCKVYYQNTFEGYKYIVAPSKVLVKQFKTFIEPIGDIGEAFGKFGRGMFTSLPWGLNIALFPIMLIAVMGFIFLGFLFFTKPHFKISIFHLFTIEMGQPRRMEAPVAPMRLRAASQRELQYDENRTIRQRRNRNDREVVLTTNHRTLVEDVSNSSHDNGENEDQTKIGDQEESYEQCCEDSNTDPDGGGDNRASSSDSLVQLPNNN